MYQFDGVSVDPANLRVVRGGEVCALEPKAFRLLLFLIENRDRAVPKEEILENVWRDAFVTDNALTRAIAQIRKALDDDSKQPRYIETVPTVGYRFVAALQPTAVAPVARQPRARLPRRVYWVVFAASVLITSGGLTAVLLTRPSAHAPVFKATQISTGDGLDIGPSFSPDGNLIAYASDRSGSFQVYVRPRDVNARELQITHDDNQNVGPVFSPDGRSIAYYSLGKPGIYRVPALGGAAQRLAGFGVHPAWSPDGKWIALQSFGGSSMSTTDSYWPQHSTLWLMPSEGGNPKQITATDRPLGGQNSPSWSPDSSEIRFVNDYKGASSVWTYRIADGSLRQAFAFRFQLGGPIFARDKRSMYYVTWQLNGDIAIWRAAIDPEKFQPVGDPQPIYVPAVGVPRDLALSADGKRLAFSILLGESKILLAGTPNGRTMSGEPRALTHEVGFRYAQCVFSSDGSLVAYTLWRKGREAAVMVSRTDGSDTWMAGPDNEGHYYPQFLADGEWVYYVATRQARAKPSVKKTRLSDRETQLVLATDAVMQGSSAAFSPDAKEMLVNDVTGPRLALNRVDLETGKVSRAAAGAVDMGYGRYSPDGKWICLDVQPPGQTFVGVAPATGGTPQVLYDRPGLAYPNGWASDSDRILFAGRYGGIWNLYWISRTTRHVEQLTHYDKLRTYVRYPSWSPDTKQLVFEYNESKGNVFVTEVQ